MNMELSEGLKLGDAIRMARGKAKLTLRRLAQDAGISAAHLSDIEHNNRRPSDEVLQKLAAKLSHVGGTYEALSQLVTRMDPEMRSWFDGTPEAHQMLRIMRESKRSPRELLEDFRRSADKKDRSR